MRSVVMVLLVSLIAIEVSCLIGMAVSAIPESATAVDGQLVWEKE